MTDETIEEIKREKARKLLEGETGETTQDESPAEPVQVQSMDEFDEITTGSGVVLVDFHAEWCGPCHMIAPVLERIAAETPATVAKVDIDAHQGLAAQHNVRGVPTLLIYADGEQVERIVGVQPEDALRSKIQQYSTN